MNLQQYLKFAALAGGITVVLIAVGWQPTVRLAGAGSPPALIAGCLVSLLASLLGALPLLFWKARGEESITLALGVMLARLGAVAVLGAAALLSGWFAVEPLLIWIALCHLVLLAADSRFTLKALHAASGTRGQAR